jgi:diadenosine tetraphosphate (Ap4A) HIT family hydrolase
MNSPFQLLFDYLKEQMRMSHIYQPVMIKRLLIDGGKSKDEDIAFDLVQNDLSQLEYYTERVNQMVGKVLRKNGIVDKVKHHYFLQGAEHLNEAEKLYLIQICDDKIDTFKKQRKQEIWDHRRHNRKSIPGTIQHDVFERAKGRCELCGISKEIKHLEVDHIIPKSLGGPDDLSNFQALCYSCNSRKGNRYKTDYRSYSLVYDHRENNCLFCSIDRKKIVEHELAFAIFDKFPVVEGHILIIPKRHFANYFEITQAELNATHALILELRQQLMNKDASITGFNIGINEGESAGQTVPHCHIHLIPRRKNDVENPQGGIRHTIPGKGFY